MREKQVGLQGGKKKQTDNATEEISDFEDKTEKIKHSESSSKRQRDSKYEKVETMNTD